MKVLVKKTHSLEKRKLGYIVKRRIYQINMALKRMKSTEKRLLKDVITIK